MQENTTIRKRIELHQRSLRVALMPLAIAALASCDEQPSPSTSTTQVVNDSAALYAALSATLDQCEDAHEACLEAAGGTGRAQMLCETEAEACRTQAQPMEQACEQELEREAHHCNSICGDEDAGPGTDEADGGSGDMNQCMARHAPRLPKCLSGLVACLDEAGICSHDVSRSEFRDCVHDTHRCIKDEWRALRAKKHNGWHHPRAGSGAPDAGVSAGSGGAGASGTPVAGSGGATTTAGNGGFDPAAAGSGGATTAGNGAVDPAAAGSGGDCDPAATAGAGGSDDGRGRKQRDWFPWKKH